MRWFLPGHGNLFLKPWDKQLWVIPSLFHHPQLELLVLPMLLLFFQLLPAFLDSLAVQMLSVHYGYDRMSIILWRSGHICVVLPILSQPVSATLIVILFTAYVAVLWSPWLCLIISRSPHIYMTVLWFLVNYSVANFLVYSSASHWGRLQGTISLHLVYSSLTQ